ncbi:MAG: nodulation protein NfeD [Candidatus Bipolaricaulota bacterium]|nr:MAG: nodulation protein NfeD [Candidatus Bipolaricaulota bacterium]
MIRRVSLLAFLFAFLVAAAAWGDVWVLTVDGEIGRGTVSYLRNGLAAAADAGASHVVIDLATPGGLLDAAVAGRDAILDATIPTVAYINREAFSAGALLAISCERIVFAPGGVLGAATPVVFDGTGVAEASEKVVSATRSLFRSTAEAFGRPPEVAEAMVDPTLAVENLVEADRLLTLSAAQAAAWGYSDGEAGSFEALLALLGAEGEPRVDYAARTIDRVLEILTTRWLAAILIAVGLVGLIVEMLVPGFGVAGILGIACLGAFFWSHVLVGLAGWESIALLLGGVLAVFLEIFVFTAADFGAAGLAGLVLIGLGFYTAMVGPLTDREAALRAIAVVSAAVLVGIAVAVVLLARLPKTRLRFGGVILSSTISGRAFRRRGPVEGRDSWAGMRGTAATDLRPVGVGRFGEERIDVVCQEGYLAKGTAIEVVEDAGIRKVVRRIEGGERE